MLIVAATVTSCVSFFACASLACVPVGTASSAVEIKICAITSGIKNISQLSGKSKKAWWNSVTKKI